MKLVNNNAIYIFCIIKIVMYAYRQRNGKYSLWYNLLQIIL